MTADLEFFANLLGVITFSWGVAKSICAKVAGWPAWIGENQVLALLAVGVGGSSISLAVMGLLVADVAGGPQWFGWLLEELWLNLPKR